MSLIYAFHGTMTRPKNHWFYTGCGGGVGLSLMEVVMVGWMRIGRRREAVMCLGEL